MYRLLTFLCPGWLLLALGCGGQEKGTVLQPPSAHPPAEAPVENAEAVACVAPPPLPSYTQVIRPLVTRYCLTCHNSSKTRGGIDLEAFPDEATVRKNLPLWQKVAENLRSGSMPPAGKPPPTPAELDTLNTWLDAAVFQVDCSGRKTPSRVTLRRLNRAEYNNTIRDLTGIDLRPADDFPTDDVGEGFDNIGDVLSLPPLLMEKYLAAAEKIVEAAFQSPAARERLLNPPVKDTVPRSFRGATPPVRGEAVKTVRQPGAGAPPIDDPKVRELQRAYRILRTFADRAYRRPVTHDELTRLLRFVEIAHKNNEDYEQGIRLALQAILVSPHLLFRIELDPDPNNPDAVHPVKDFELASQLSYFLWSSMPDEELFRHAVQGTLRKGDNLEAQVQRMLRDGKSRSLVDNFAGQWLQTRNLKDLTPDPDRFSHFDEPLRRAMLQETERFVAHIVREDRSILDFLNADYTFVNERLARHYGISGVQGEEFRRVSLAGTPRGGILTHASVLAVTSNPTRTSPVKRGKWILENMLGAPPPAPPPDVEQLKEDQETVLAGTLRQRMEQHRTNPQCASCHQRMDPLGFGLENFDAVGAWRTRDGQHPIDPSGTLPGGQSFQGPAELRALLLTRREAFARCLAEKLLTYALGRGLEPSDRCAVNDIARKLARKEYRFSALVLAIVRSDPFQFRQGKRENP